jgi:hypothetical protein
MACAYNPSTAEAEAGRSSVEDQFELHSNSLSQNQKTKDPEKIEKHSGDHRCFHL